VQPLLETHVRGRGLRMATAEESRRRLASGATTEATREADAPAAASTREPLAPWRLVVCGHSHLPRVMQVSSDCLVVNPGSVGLPAYDYEEDGETHYVENGAPHASYAIVEEIEVIGAAPRWQASLHHIPYDWERAAQLAMRNKRPEWAFALRTGFALRA
jgi:hypothetical protein